ncbi:MAG: undecaprenyldiphospho-muramoylpentapeptide beta-N-acetylglucosaminyltransferase [Myxococcales bacterium]|nr:undecaprenyldiphospho-muramoylpentapeptide beta-N-acetylglucosaminyltransferase [Myxococcales bacterium]
MSWAVAGGGTGGHVTMALALAEEIRARGGRPVLLGTDQGLERTLVPEAGFELVTFDARQVMGQRLLARVAALFGLLRTTFAARRALRAHGATAVVSVGGYASMPAVAAAALMRLPIALIEPNAIPGRANRLMARVAKRVFVGFEGAQGHLPVPAERVQRLGIPLRRALVDAFADRPERKPEPPFRLLVAGGSQGARQVNEAMMEIAPRLDADRVTIFHQSGADDRDRVAEAYAAAGLEAEVVAFTDDMPARYAWADLAVCRSGALTVAELALAGLPSLLVPYPYAADDHQAANAEALASPGADGAPGARMLSSRPLDVDALASAIAELFSEPERLVQMKRALASRARPDAAREIVDACAEVFGPPST